MELKSEMMLDPGLEERVEIPEEVEVEIEEGVVTVSGPNSELSKEFDLHGVEIFKKDDEVVITAESSRKEKRASVGTVVSHINNLFKGVTEGFTCKLKVFYSHFPVSLDVEGDELVIENFLGEEEPRRAKIVGETEIEIDGDEVNLKGPNKEEVGQSAANIEQTAKAKNRDPRTFQDGIYIVEAI